MYDVTLTCYSGNVRASIPGIRATAELSELDPETIAELELPKGSWLWFNRLLNQSGKPGVGTALLDAVMHYCQEREYSILCWANAYGDLSQRELERWYMRKGFRVINRELGTSGLMWTPE